MQRAGIFRIAADHPSLPGHFAGRPVVPGVVLLDEVFAVIQAGQVIALSSVKFLSPVLPEQDVSVRVGAISGGQMAFACDVDGQDVLRGTLLLDHPR